MNIFAQISYSQLLEQLKKDLAPSIQQQAPVVASAIPGWLHPWIPAIIITIGLIAAAYVLYGTFFRVSTQTVAVVERFGKFNRMARAGLNFKLPLVEKVVDTLSLQQEQHTLHFESLTKDKVTVTVYATIQYKIIPDKEYDAYYLLDDPSEQIERFFFDIMRAQVPVRTLDDLYAVKDEISLSAVSELAKDMTPFGYVVQRVLITSIDPDKRVKAAMNDINAAQREAQAAEARGNAAKIMQVKEAEGRAESDTLRGKGIAGQRIEIAKGFETSINEIRAATPTATDQQIITLLMMTQHLEMIEKIGTTDNTSTIFIDRSPAGVLDLKNQIMQALAVKPEEHA